MDRKQIIAEIERHSLLTNLAPATICDRAVGNSRLFKRLLEGGECLPRTARKLRAWMGLGARPGEDAETGKPHMR